jgi:hypothetical protein
MSDQQPPRGEDLIGSTDTIVMQDIPLGARIRVRGGGEAEVTANPRDGAWVFVRHADGTEDMVFCTDVLEVL